VSTTHRLGSALADRYRLERELGAGGMATVYLAQDLKHDRKVALKVLKPELAAVLGAERFIVEIKTTAALQHPHILPLFDSGESDGFLWYAMPFIDGETLRGKLDRETQLGIEESVRITSDVASALHYAHTHGVVHRDIKPENILLHDGRPMVADFGIALAVSAAAGGRMTETGLSLGTPHYMSPEQATAEKEIGPRSDVYSLGSVLYEMLTGNPPHSGGSAQQIIMKIIAEEPAPVTRMRRAVPTNVAAAVAKALEKLPADRFESANAFAEALGSPAFRHRESQPSRAHVSRIRDPLVQALAIVAVAAIGVAGWSLTREQPARPVSRYTLRLPDGVALGGPFTRVALTPDGHRILALGRDSLSLWFQARDQLEPTRIAGSDGAIGFFLSPEGDRVAFHQTAPGVAGSALRVIPLQGGNAVTLADTLLGGAGGTWSTDGNIYLDGAGPSPLVRLPATGGKAPELFTSLDSASGETEHIFPDALPNGKGVLFTILHGPETTLKAIGVARTSDGTHKELVRGVFARYAASGHLLYLTADGSLMAAPFDQDAMEITGDAVLVVAGVARRVIDGPDLAISSDGTLLYTTGGTIGDGGGEPVWVGRDGRATPVAPGWSGIANVALSPDATRLAVAVSRTTNATDIWVRHLDRGTMTRLTDAGANFRPSWSPDARRVYFLSTRIAARLGIYARRADGSTAEERIHDHPGHIQEVLISRDTTWMLFRTGSGGTETNIYARRFTGDTSTIEIAASDRYREAAPTLSPDARWIAYASNETGRHEVYIQPFPNVAGGKWPVSPSGGDEPLWSRDGRELFYRNGAGEMVAVEILSNGSPPIGQQRALFSTLPYLRDAFYRSYDVTPDRQRFVMLRRPTGQGVEDTRLIVVENFLEELRAKVPQ